jgi:monofunctional glycosyltransferase
MIKKILLWTKKAVKWFFIVSVLSVIIFRFVPVPITPLMITRCIDQKMAGKEMILSHDWEPIENISPNLQKAVIASEDGNFMNHFGFDFDAMQKAFKGNLKGKRIKGGSTISQQTVKNVFLWQGRSYVRKVLEAYFTVLIEIFWSKERIMEVYLNSIEMGDGVYGAEAASQHWFKNDAKNLSKVQAASIAAILPNPRIYKATNSSGYTERRKTRILKHINRVGKLEY